MAGSGVYRAVLSQTLNRFRSAGGGFIRISAGNRSVCVRLQFSETRVCGGETLGLWGKSEQTRHPREKPSLPTGRRRSSSSNVGSRRSSDEDKQDEAQRKEDEMILLLKKAKLSLSRGQLQAASGFLHQAVTLAHQTHNNQAIIYTYSLMANLAYVQGHLDQAEKLFKAAMSFMLSGGTPQDDNAVIEMSLKLATIYAEQNKLDLAEHGFRFCTESLEAKLEKQKDLAAEQQTEEQEALRKETRLLLGLCLDSRARYRASTQHLNQAEQDYQKALNICRQEQGETHPQTLVLMSDLATILDLLGRHDDALLLVQQAVDLSRSAGHPDQHVLLGNMAGILLHKGQLEDSVRFYKEALSLARQARDQEALDKIQEGLKEVKKRRDKERKEEEQEHAEE